MPSKRITRRSTSSTAAAIAASSLTQRDSKSNGGIEMVTSEPVLVGEGRFSPKFRMTIFEAVDYLGTRFRIGDHVLMYTPDGQEWVCVLEALYKDTETNVAMFIGRWFWSVEDVQAQEDLHKEVMRPSKCPSHELLACDSRDSNKVESISRKCHVLSYDNFQLVKKTVLRNDCDLDKVFFCERQFHHIAFRFSELNSIIFPGDPIPMTLRKAAGLPMDDDYHQLVNGGGNYGGVWKKNRINSCLNHRHDDVIDVANAYYEPDYSGKTKRKKDKLPNVSSDPIHIW